MSRLQAILLTAAGLLVLAAMLLRGRRLGSALRRGPRWRRRLVAVALVSLTGLGVLSAERAGAALVEVVDEPATDDELARNADWRAVVAVWSAAKNIADGKAGLYPFLNDDSQNEFLARLDKAGEGVNRLANDKHLTAAEAGLLVQGLADLRSRVSRYRPKTMMMATCYKPAMLRPAAASADRLQARLNLLEQLAQQTAVRRAVLDTVLANIEADIAVLADAKNSAGLKPEEQASHTRIRESAAKFIAKIKETDAAVDPVVRTSEWQTIAGAWSFCRQGNNTQRLEAAGKLDAARAAIAALLRKKMVQEKEAELLLQEADLLRDQLPNQQPARGAMMCYLVGPPPAPARASLQRLAERLPLLVELRDAGKLKRAVIESLLPTLQNDLARVSNGHNDLTEAERQQLPEPRKQAEENLKKLKQAK